RRLAAAGLPLGRMLLAAGIGLLLAGCAARPHAVVVKRSLDTHAPAAASAAQRPSEYSVVRGATLLAIAFRHGVDFRDVARWNGIAALYTIYPGQRLRMDGPAASAREVAARPAARPPMPQGGLTAPDAPTATPTPALTAPSATALA